MSGPSRVHGGRLLELRVVGYLPAMRCGGPPGDDLRAGVAQASREETAANATGWLGVAVRYGDWVGAEPDVAAWCDGWSSPMTMGGMFADVRLAS